MNHPNQLPALPPPGPRPELDQLRTLYHQEGGEQGRIIVLHGPSGSGKTQLAAHFLHRHLDHFTDGILFAGLQEGSDPGEPADVSDVLDHFLRSIHVGADVIPADFGARAAAWRSSTYRRKIAVLADDAASAAQVRVLVPGRGPHLVVVTTRRLLAGLRMDGADLIGIHHSNTTHACHEIAVPDRKPRRVGGARAALMVISGTGNPGRQRPKIDFIELMNHPRRWRKVIPYYTTPFSGRPQWKLSQLRRLLYFSCLLCL